jgi:hypothetical protein
MTGIFFRLPLTLIRRRAVTQGYFEVGGASGDRLSPQQYGYWLLRWSHDNTSGVLEDLKSQTFKDSAYAAAFRGNAFWAYLQFLALHAACYWYYASEVLGVPEEAQHQMKVGLDDAVKDMRNPGGQSLSDFEENYLRSSISAYFQANAAEHDYARKADPRVFRPDASELSKKFFEIIAPAYPQVKPVSPVDQFLLGHHIAVIPGALFSALKNEIKVAYVA